MGTKIDIWQRVVVLFAIKGEGSGNVLSSGQSAGGALVDALGRMAESLDRVAGMLCRLEAEHERRRGE